MFVLVLFFSVYLRVLNLIYVQHFCLEPRQQHCPHTALSSMFCMQWLKAVKWKKTWPYRPPVSDDDEGITAVEATGGESVQLQRVQHAVVLTIHKHPEDWAANMRLFYLQDSLLCGHDILEAEQEKSHLFIHHDHSVEHAEILNMLNLRWMIANNTWKKSRRSVFMWPYESWRFLRRGIKNVGLPEAVFVVFQVMQTFLACTQRVP